MKFAKTYSDVDSLRKIDPSLLKKLIDKFKIYFSPHQVINTEGDIDFDQLRNALMALNKADGNEIPETLLDILHSVQEMSTSEKMDELLELLRPQAPDYFKKIKTHGPVDVALYCRLHYPELFDRQYALSQLSKKRSFEYVLGKSGVNQSKKLTSEMENLFIEKTRQWCRKNNRPTFVNCIINQKTQDITWIIIIHGEPLRREAKVSDSKEANSVYYHPQKTDLLIYDRVKNRVQMKCDSPKLAKYYCGFLGEACFNDPDYFNKKIDPFTLEPISKATNADYDWNQVEGIDTIRLSTVIIRHGDHIEVRKTNADYFGEIVARTTNGESLHVVKATFKFRFSGQKNEREITISKDKVNYVRNEDSFILEKWLDTHGFACYTTTAQEIKSDVCLV